MNLITKAISNCKYLLNPDSVLIAQIRGKARKSVGSCVNPPRHPRPKHRGWKRQDGHFVNAGTILATQRTLRFLPGLNVGFGRNGTLHALEHGKVWITCEKTNLNWNHSWVQRLLLHRKGQEFYKKYYHVIPVPEHQRFKLIDEI